MSRENEISLLIAGMPASKIAEARLARVNGVTFHSTKEINRLTGERYRLEKALEEILAAVDEDTGFDVRNIQLVREHNDR